MIIYNFVKKYNITKSTFLTYFTGLCVIFYFLFITIFGAKGLIQYHLLQEKIAQKEHIKKDIKSRVQNKQNMVDAMDKDSLDVDLLDEQARKSLGYSGKNEVVIYQDEQQEKKKKNPKKSQ